MLPIRTGITKLASDGLVEFLKAVDQYLRGKVKRNRTYIRTKCWTYHRLAGYNAPPNPLKIVYISPQEIEKYSPAFGKWESVGKIQGGSWDKEATPVEQMIKYQAVEEHFCNGVSWENTGIIEHLLERLSEQERTSIDGCKTREELEERYTQIDQLFNKINEYGYQEDRHSQTDYIATHIGRNGKFIFAGSGCHRLSISKILDLDEIPVWIRARHTKWQKVREEINQATTREELSETAISHLRHPDMQDIVGKQLQEGH